ncbi:hypothetical protein [Faecalibacterium prausnitzii]
MAKKGNNTNLKNTMRGILCQWNCRNSQKSLEECTRKGFSSIAGNKKEPVPGENPGTG